MEYFFDHLCGPITRAVTKITVQVPSSDSKYFTIQHLFSPISAGLKELYCIKIFVS
jgi:hypothetical protein